MTLSADGVSKVCSGCKAMKSLSEFTKRKKSKDGHNEYCRPCASIMHEKWRSRKLEDYYAEIAAKFGPTRKCSCCKKTQTVDSFYRHKHEKFGLNPFCKECVRRGNAANKERRRNDPALRELDAQRIRSNKLKQTYGVTLEEYLLLEKKQHGVCAICEQPETNTLRGTLRSLAVDHDHMTGAVRGLLCNSCNNGLGRFQDSPSLLEKAAAYLRNHQVRLGVENNDWRNSIR